MSLQMDTRRGCAARRLVRPAAVGGDYRKSGLGLAEPAVDQADVGRGDQSLRRSGYKVSEAPEGKSGQNWRSVIIFVPLGAIAH